MEDILGKLLEHGSTGALLFIAVRYLVKKLEKKEAEIARLNELLLANQKEETDISREAEKQAVKTMGEINGTLKELIPAIKYGKKK